jgi:hypothetical protein
MTTVQEVSSINLAYSQGFGRASEPQAGAVKSSAQTVVGTDKVWVESTAKFTEFVALASEKDEAMQYARSIREADQALADVKEIVKDIGEAVALVKNYPPFPPGNDGRMQYINGINGLRQQLESMVVPPVKGDSEAVFYPREAALPVLDAMSATDDDVQAFGPALTQLQDKLDAGVVALHKRAQALPEKINADLPLLPATEEAVGQLINEVTARLADSSRALVMGQSGLSRLGV